VRCVLALATVAAGSACADFDTTRVVPPRGTLGRELYSLVCDRVGANALREDVTASSYHDICHQRADGSYQTEVDQSLLVALDPNAVDVDGKPVPLADQQKHRAYRVARIEALARRREDLIKAFDAAFPVATIPIKNLGADDPTKSCAAAGTGPLQKELADVLSRFTDMENDRTFPMVTESLAKVLDDVKTSPEAQAALARFDARQGYRPSDVALGASRALLSYPQITDLVNTLLKLVATDSDPLSPSGRIDPSQPLSIDNRKPIPGAASAQMQSLLATLHEELRTSDTPMPLAQLTVTTDAQIPSRQLLSRPRTSLELTRQLLLQEDAAYDDTMGTPLTRFVVKRDLRGLAVVPLVNGRVPAPFVDMAGGANGPDGLPDIDPLGQLITTAPIASPFFSVDGVDGRRDATGRAVGTQTPLLYDYVDANKTFLAHSMVDLRPLLDPDPAHDKEAIMKLLGGLPIVSGQRDAQPTTSRDYAPDPSLVADWQLAHTGPPPPGLGTSPVSLKYRAFHADTSPLVDLVYALGQLMNDPAVDDLLELARKLVVDHPNELARLVGIGLQIKSIADQHPEAHIPAQSMLWDEMLDTLAKIAHVKDSVNAGGILEDIILAFKDPATVKLQDTFAAYIQFKDSLTYNHHSTAPGLSNELNGAAWNLSTNDTSPLKTPVDRAQPDIGENRSALQKFLQLLHDANGLDACTKDGAILPINWNGVQLHYPPQSFGEHLVLDSVCIGVNGQPAPSHLPLCGVLRFQNVAHLLLDVALNRVQLDIRDACLKNLMNSPLTGIVGGADNFLQTISGIKGFDTHPTVPGISRFVYFDAPHDGMPGDPNPNTAITRDLIGAVVDPVPSMVCPPMPFTDSDGTVLNLRKCASFADTLRGRDPGFLLPIEQNDFVANVQKLAAAFDDHQQALLFVDLFDTMHLHWGSNRQTADICDPSANRATDSRWCSQDGVVTYEPLLADIMTKTDLFTALHDTVPIIEQTIVTHCDKQDATTHQCTQTSTRTGVQVLADAVRLMVDPARNAGLTDRRGNAYAVRNDGTKNPQVTRIYLLIDALKAFDTAFDAWAAANPTDNQRQTKWRSARSQIVDTFFSTKGAGTMTTWSNPAIPKILPALIDALHAQLIAHCPDRSAPCAWAKTDLPKNLGDVVSGPTFAGVVDLLDAIRKDDAARTGIEKLLQYLLDGSSANDTRAATLGAAVDVLQLLSDDTNMSPLYRAIANATGSALVDEKGVVVRRALLDAVIESLSRIFAHAIDGNGVETCSAEVDPNRAIASVLKNFVTPTATNAQAPIETIIDVIADVNRSQPNLTTKLEATDYGNICNEISEFCLDKGSGLEQVYEVIREATLK
jgi:hypothetical protein